MFIKRIILNWAEKWITRLTNVQTGYKYFIYLEKQ